MNAATEGAPMSNALTKDAAATEGCAAVTGYVTAPKTREYSCGWCNGTGMIETDETWKCAMCEGTGTRIIASRSHTTQLADQRA